MVWNEALVSGPLNPQIGTKEFWDIRRQYFDHQLPANLSIPPTSYQKLVLTEIQKLEKLDHYHHLVLWFEHDLFCQINLMGLLSLIRRCTET